MTTEGLEPTVSFAEKKKEKKKKKKKKKNKKNKKRRSKAAARQSPKYTQIQHTHAKHQTDAKPPDQDRDQRQETLPTTSHHLPSPPPTITLDTFAISSLDLILVESGERERND